MPSKSKYQHKVLRLKNWNFFVGNSSVSGQNNLVRSRIWILQRLVDPDWINEDMKHFINSIQICSFMNHKKCRPYKNTVLHVHYEYNYERRTGETPNPGLRIQVNITKRHRIGRLKTWVTDREPLKTEETGFRSRAQKAWQRLVKETLILNQLRDTVSHNDGNIKI